MNEHGTRYLTIPLEEYQEVYSSAIAVLESMGPEFDKHNEAMGKRMCLELINTHREDWNAYWLIAYGALLPKDELRNIPMTNSGWLRLARRVDNGMWWYDHAHNRYGTESSKFESLLDRVVKKAAPGDYRPYPRQSEVGIMKQCREVECREYRSLLVQYLSRLNQFNGMTGGVTMDPRALREFQILKQDNGRAEAARMLYYWQLEATKPMPDLVPLMEDQHRALTEAYKPEPTPGVSKLPEKATPETMGTMNPQSAVLLVSAIIMIGYALSKLF